MTRPQPMPQTVLAILDSTEWTLTRNPADPAMTDEYNQNNAWSVARATAPFSSASGARTWAGPTAYAALMAGHLALGLAGPKPEMTPERAFEAWLDAPVDWDFLGHPISRRSTMDSLTQAAAQYGWLAAMKHVATTNTLN